METIRFGIIGYGVQGKLYASILTGKGELQGIPIQKPKNCCLTAISSRSGSAEEEYGEDTSVSLFRGWKELVDSGVCDAIIITVPHFQHTDVAIYALERNLHVLCEKPAAIRAFDVEQMLTVAKEHPESAFGLILNQRTNPVFRKIKDLVDSGKLGEIRRSNWMINSWWRPDSYYKSSPWRGTWNGEGGGVLVNQAPHQLDLWGWICGVPTTVFAICREGCQRDITVENDVTMVTEYENGATGCFITSTHDPLGTNRLEIDCSKGKIVVEDNKKAVVTYFAKEEQEWNQTLDLRQFSEMLYRNPEALFTSEEIAESLPIGQEYVLIFENFAAHILTGEALIAPAEDGLFSVQLANIAQLSSAKKQQLSFPCDTTEFNEFLKNRMEQENE